MVYLFSASPYCTAVAHGGWVCWWVDEFDFDRVGKWMSAWVYVLSSLWPVDRGPDIRFGSTSCRV